jgi:hypothetical protein
VHEAILAVVEFRKLEQILKFFIIRRWKANLLYSLTHKNDSTLSQPQPQLPTAPLPTLMDDLPHHKDVENH